MKQQTIIMTNVIDMVKFLNREDITIVKTELVKGIAGEQVAKVTYYYNEED